MDTESSSSGKYLTTWIAELKYLIAFFAVRVETGDKKVTKILQKRRESVS